MDKDEMAIICEIKHYIDAMLNSYDALNKKPTKETTEYLHGFIHYCKAYVWLYANKYTKLKKDEFEDEFKDSE